MKKVKLAECGLSYAVVSIMGPQSSGMSYFSTKCLVICLTMRHSLGVIVD